MLYRQHPKCPKCGESIPARHHETNGFFVGDTFAGWDYENHRCRLGIKYFIERTDTHHWWTGRKIATRTGKLWTNDPQLARMFDTKEQAEHYLKESFIPPRVECEITEHEFVPTEPPREPTMKDFLQGYKR